MESALIVSSKDKNAGLFIELLRAASIKQIVSLESAGEARRLLLERDFDLVIVNSPLSDESGESFSRHIASKGLSQVILAVRSDFFEGVSAMCESDGVLIVAKPVNKTFFWSVLSLAKSAQNRIMMERIYNRQLSQKIEDIRIVDKAKYILITQSNMTEHEAHRFIEKQAMDLRSSRKIIAEGILKTYEN